MADYLKGLSKSLIDDVRKLMEGKELSPKQKKIAGMAGDKNKIDAEDLKKLRGEEVAEEVEQIDELSTDTLEKYRDAAKKDPAFEKRKGKISAARKTVMAKRTKGIETANKKISAGHKKEWDEHKAVQNAVTEHLKNNAGKILQKHGFTKLVDNEKRGVYVKGDDKAGIAHTVTVHKSDKHYSPNHVSTYSSTTGWQSSDDRHYSDRNRHHTAYNKMADVEKHKADAEHEYENHIKAQHDYHHKHGLEESVQVSGDMINEALDAAARYGDHHTAIKSLLKSISQHVENHKADALKHKDYRGKKGVTWGHVGDLADVHQQLANIHDRLAQQGEYKKTIGESVEDDSVEQIDELSRKTMANYIKGAAKDIEYNAAKRQKFQPWENDKDPDIRAAGRRRVGNADKALDKRLKGSSMAANKLAREEVELSAEELERIESLAAELELDEARGRPRKDAAKSPEDEANEPRQHIIQQLQRAKLSMHGGAKVRFQNGETHEIHGRHASTLLDKYAGMKPHEKEAFQKKIGASHEGLKSEL